MSFDYKNLLVKYMHMVLEIEGTLFSGYWKDFFSEQEAQILKEIDQTLDSETN